LFNKEYGIFTFDIFMKPAIFLLILSSSFFPAFSQKQKFNDSLYFISSDNLGSNAFLKGNYLELGIGPNGSFVSTIAPPSGYHPRSETGPYFGLVSDTEKNGWTTGVRDYIGDYIARGSYWEGFKVQFNSEIYTNRFSITNISGSNLTTVDEPFTKKANWVGEVTGKFKIKQNVTLGIDNTYFTVKITIINQSPSSANFYYSRFVDPDNEQYYTGDYDTRNRIVGQGNENGRSLVRSQGLSFGAYLALSSSDTRSCVGIAPLWGALPADYFNGSRGVYKSGVIDDDAEIGIVFKSENISSMDSVVYEFSYLTRIEDEESIGCSLPIVYKASKVLENSFDVNFSNYSSTSFSIRYKQNGTENWIYSPSILSPLTDSVTYSIEGLSQNTNYIYQIRKFCPGGFDTSYSDSYSVTTNCIGLQNSIPHIDTLIENKALIKFDINNKSNMTNIRYRKVGSLDWIDIGGILADEYELNNLIPNTFYEVQNQSSCIINNSLFSPSTLFKSKKCPKKVVLNGNIDGGLYEVLDSLVSKSYIDKNTIFSSGKSILLEPGFRTLPNNVFTAKINSCFSNLESGLVAYFPFKGNVLDSSGSNVLTSFQNTSMAVGFNGQPNSSISFNGTNSWGNILNEFDILPKSINLWFNNSRNYSYGQYGSIYQSDNPYLTYGNTGIAVVNFNGQNEIFLTYSAVSASKPVLPNTWYNVCITVDELHNINYYLNGELIDSKSFTGYVKSSQGLQSSIVGSSRNANNSFFNGKIDEIRIYNRVLTPIEVKEIYDLK